MLTKTDNPEKNIAADDELNPLSNPLLSANMGRWAEVYFTNRPEHRDRAVLDLVRELEIEAGEKDVSPHDSGATALQPSSHAASSSTKIEERGASAKGIACHACGYVNSDTHSYCGMCGIPLTVAAQPDTTTAVLAPEAGEVDEHFGSRSRSLASEWQDNQAGSAEHEGEFLNSSANFDDSDLPQFARQPAAVVHHGRLYLGLVLAVLLGGLIYVAKRGSVVFDGQRSPDAKMVPAAQPAPDAQALQDEGSNAPQPNAPETKQNPPQAMSKANPQPETPSQPAPAAKRPVSTPTARAASAQGRHASATQSGADDLAEAQGYLDRNHGSVQQALPLLWNATAKGNATAMVALSDLYLRGKVVPQNCDQARMLLDLAAKKGAKGASARLRHLQAFGCG